MIKRSIGEQSQILDFVFSDPMDANEEAVLVSNTVQLEDPQVVGDYSIRFFKIGEADEDEIFEEPMVGNSNEELMVDEIKSEPEDEIIEEPMVQEIKIEPADTTEEPKKKPFECDFCHQPYNDLQGMNQHIEKRHNNKKQVKCKVCEYWIDFDALKEHYNRRHRRKCELCFKEFKTKKEFAEHYFQCQKEKGPQKCKDCPRKCKTKEELKGHIERRHGKGSSRENSRTKIANGKPTEIILNVKAQDLFEAKEKESKKLRTEMNQKEKHLTENLAKVKMDNSNLGRIIKIQSETIESNTKVINTLAGDIKTLHEKEQRQRQIRENNEQNRINQSQRQIRLTPMMYMNRDQPQTLNSRPFQCAFCGKAFTEKTLYKKHKESHLKCEECNSAFVFRSMNDLEEHKKNYHYQKPFQCRKCDKRYSSTGQLVFHLTNHCTNLKRLEIRCDLCNKQFNNRREQTRHLKFNNCPEKRCEHCGERFEIQFSKFSNAPPIIRHRCKKTRKENDRRY